MVIIELILKEKPVHFKVLILFLKVNFHFISLKLSSCRNYAPET